MSFDVFVYFPVPGADFIRRWEAAIEDHLGRCKVIDDPSGRDRGNGAWMIRPLGADDPGKVDNEEDEGYPVYFGRVDFERERSLHDARLPKRVRDFLFKTHLDTPAGRGEDALRWQVYAAATLMDASNGLLLDPQFQVDDFRELADTPGFDDLAGDGVFTTPSLAYAWAATLAQS